MNPGSLKVEDVQAMNKGAVAYLAALAKVFPDQSAEELFATAKEIEASGVASTLLHKVIVLLKLSV